MCINNAKKRQVIFSPHKALDKKNSAKPMNPWLIKLLFMLIFLKIVAR